MTSEIVDITPHPAILSVLGEIEFKPWQCVAELIDNCIDGFLSAKSLNSPIVNASVKVAFGGDTVVVKDNGPGMALEELQNSVRAGWSSHSKFGSLGLYGVGFNIATARLGSITTIWTTRNGDVDWVGLTIDLRQIRLGGSYQLMVQRRHKAISRLSGTEIEITNLRPDWKNLFLNVHWVRGNITKRLERVYSTMLRTHLPLPIGFALYVNDKRVSAWEHCVWSPDWEVYRKELNYVRPVREINMVFSQKYLSRVTGEIFDTPDMLDPSETIVIPERVYGWIGIQRYIDDTDYGIDILRNGRKIEDGCKDLFYWEDDAGKRILEYPIDDFRSRGGRIVGEIHLDHGYVHYTKHRFEREHISWTHLLKAVRNDEPLVNRSNFNFDGANDSPLGILFRTFRRNSPMSSQTHWDILVLKENDDAKRWTQEYRKGNSDYLNEDWWEEQIRKQDRLDDEPEVLNTDKNGATAGSNNLSEDEKTILAGGNSNTPPPPSTEAGTNNSGTENEKENHNQPPTPTEVQRKLINELSFYNLHGIGRSGRIYNIETYAANADIKSNHPQAWRGRLTERGVFEIEIDFHHVVFQSTSFHYLDAILSEIAYMITSEEQSIAGTTQRFNYSDILVDLRRRFVTTASLDANRLRMEIDNLRSGIAQKLALTLSNTQQLKILDELPNDEAKRIEISYAQGSVSSSLIEYAQMRHLTLFFEKYPEVFFHAGCFKPSWSPERIRNDDLLQQHRSRLVRDILVLMSPLGEYADLVSVAIEDNQIHRHYIRASVNMLREYVTE